MISGKTSSMSREKKKCWKLIDLVVESSREKQQKHRDEIFIICFSGILICLVLWMQVIRIFFIATSRWEEPSFIDGILRHISNFFKLEMEK